MNNLPDQQSRVAKEWARKHAKRAWESPAEKERRKKVSQEQNMLHRASESEAQCIKRLAAGQQPEAQHVKRFAAGQLREVNHRASESEHAQCLAADQQRNADRRASESDARQEYWLSSN